MSSLKVLAEKYETLLGSKRKSELSSKEVAAEISLIEQELYDALVDADMQSVSLNSGLTLYRRTDRFYGVAEGHSKQELVSALANNEQTMDLVEVNFNANSLRSRIKEIEGNGETFPQEVSALLKVSEKYRIGYRS
jgi:ketol-acid reductoisomerase